MAKNNSEIRAKVEARTKAENEAKNKKDNRINSKKIDISKIDISDEAIQGYLNENESGDAKLYNRLNRGKIIYVAEWKLFLWWSGHHWKIDYLESHASQLIEKVCEIYEYYYNIKEKEAEEEIDKIKKANLQKYLSKILRRINNLRRKNGQDNLMTMVNRVENPLFVLPDVFDNQPYLKACANGVIDLRTGELIEGRPEQYLLKAIPMEYDPELLKVDDPCPTISQYLLSSLGDKEIVDFVIRLLGYGMITKRKDHIFVIFWGEHGRNGKDTLIKLVTKVMGRELSADVNVEMFLQTGQTRSSSSASPDVLDLKGTCFAWINEAEENQKFAHNKLKKLTGGGEISARGNYDKGITKWEQTHLPIMTTNELPRARADDAPFWYRAIIVKWPFSFVDNPEQPYEKLADKDLDDKVMAELKGFLALMVRGAMDYLRGGLQIPDKVREWTKEQRTRFDDIGQFLSEWCETEPYSENPDKYTTRTRSAEIYEAFSIWYAMYRDRKHIISAKVFAGLLNKKNIAYKRSNGSWRLGITLNDQAKEEIDAYKASRSNK